MSSEKMGVGSLVVVGRVMGSSWIGLWSTEFATSGETVLGKLLQGDIVMVIGPAPKHPGYMLCLTGKGTGYVATNLLRSFR